MKRYQPFRISTMTGAVTQSHISLQPRNPPFIRETVQHIIDPALQTGGFDANLVYCLTQAPMTMRGLRRTASSFGTVDYPGRIDQHPTIPEPEFPRGLARTSHHR